MLGPLYFAFRRSLSLIIASGIDFEKPKPDHVSVGVLDSEPTGFFCIAVQKLMKY